MNTRRIAVRSLNRLKLLTGVIKKKKTEFLVNMGYMIGGKENEN